MASNLKQMDRSELYTFLKLLLEFHISNSTELGQYTRDIKLEFLSAKASLDTHFNPVKDCIKN